jgi:crossover junction endodeoxyribonuclease RuvC
VSYFCGVDPGKSGAFAVLNSKGQVKALSRMPSTPKEIAVFLKPYVSFDGIKESIVYVELVHSMPSQGVASMFSFGKNVGELMGVLHTFDYLLGPLTIKEVTPQKWKNTVIGKVPKIEGESKADRKKRLKQLSIAKAKELYPGVNLLATERSKVESDGIAEALLISYLCWMENK